MRKKVLIIDDNENMLKTMGVYLANHGFRVSFANNGSMGLALAKEFFPEIIITDVGMPDISGFEFCKIIKGDADLSHIPVIIISGEKVDEEDIINGYQKGADDYLIKPFSYNLLLAKIEAVLRRFSPKQEKNVSKFNLKINPLERTVEMEGRLLKLTRKEFDLLLLIISKENQVLGIPYLLDNVWGYDPAVYNDPHTVEVHVSRLRKKLGGNIGKRIEKITGVGYKFNSRD